MLQAESASYNESGLEALVFTAEGDMRQALNNAQATSAGFGFISSDNVFKVCDQPHPLLVKQMLHACGAADFMASNKIVEELWSAGYCGLDIVGTLFRLTKVRPHHASASLTDSTHAHAHTRAHTHTRTRTHSRVLTPEECAPPPCRRQFEEKINEEVKLEFIKEIGFCHMRVLDGLDSLMQLSGLVAKLCVTATRFNVRPPVKG